MRGDRAMAEGRKRIDLGAPLRSVRCADALPYHKADLKSGPVRQTGTVPFQWEQRPGQPKSVRTRRPPPSPLTSSQTPRLSENCWEEGIGASPYNDALGESCREALHGVAADGFWAGAAARKVDADAKQGANAPELLSVAEVLRKEEDEDGDEERFSDALETLSRTESFTMNCSVSGITDTRDTAPRVIAEPGARGFMMDRFLPAAQAVAVGSPQYTFRKASAASSTGSSSREHAAAANGRMGNDDDRVRRIPVQLPYQNLPPNYLSCNYPRQEEHDEDEEDDDDSYDVHSTRGFAPKGCGLLPGLCVKSSLLLLNPVPMMKCGKVRGRGTDSGLPSKGRGLKAPIPLAPSAQNKHLECDPKGQSWEDVYKHKLEQKYIHQGEERRSNQASESNHLTFWSDSQAGDGYSPFHHSIGAGASLYRRDIVLSPSSKAHGSSRTEDKDEKLSRSNGSSSLGRDHDHGSLVGSSDQSSFKGSSSMSSGLDRTIHEDSIDQCGDIDSETSQLALLPDSKTSLNSRCDTQLRGQQVVRRNTLEGQEYDPSTGMITEMPEPALLVPSGYSGSVKPNDRKNFTHDTSQGVPLHSEDNSVVKKEITHMQYLLPLPVPKSPSESWLSRNLPSVTNKPPVPSFLGIQVQSKKQLKQAPWDSMHPKENDLKHSRPRQIRFADVVERPNSMDSEI